MTVVMFGMHITIPPALEQSQKHLLLRPRISIHSVTQRIFLNTHYVAGIAQGAVDTMVIKTGKNGNWPLGAHVLVGGTDSKPTNIEKGHKEN